MKNPVALALVRLIVEFRGRLALAGNWLESTGLISTSVSFKISTAKSYQVVSSVASLTNDNSQIPCGFQPGRS